MNDLPLPGDGSLGALQKAEQSHLSWALEYMSKPSEEDPDPEEPLRAGPDGMEMLLRQLHRRMRPHEKVKRVRCQKVHFKENDDKRKEGIMLFAEVPTSGTLRFTFGEGGYSALEMQVGPDILPAE